LSEIQKSGCERADSAVLAIAEERLRVDKQVVETALVRVGTVVREREETIELPTSHEEVVVERRPVDRFVDVAPPVRQEGDSTIVPVMEEVLVVEKRLKVREELVITRKRVETVARQTVLLRHEEPTIEREELNSLRQHPKT
jgi:uncharacterized protein (TIGR02271 family)